MNRNTTVRDKHRALIRNGRHPRFPTPEPPCAICGQSIDYQAHRDDPESFTVDHIVPYSISRDDSLANKQPAHRRCNRAKSDAMPGQDAPACRSFVTARTW